MGLQFGYIREIEKFEHHLFLYSYLQQRGRLTKKMIRLMKPYFSFNAPVCKLAASLLVIKMSSNMSEWNSCSYWQLHKAVEWKSIGEFYAGRVKSYVYYWFPRSPVSKNLVERSCISYTSYNYDCIIVSASMSSILTRLVSLLWHLPLSGSLLWNVLTVLLEVLHSGTSHESTWIKIKNLASLKKCK